MLTKAVAPKTKADLIRALQAASFRSFDVLEGATLSGLPAGARLEREGATVIVIRP